MSIEARIRRLEIAGLCVLTLWIGSGAAQKTPKEIRADKVVAGSYELVGPSGKPKGEWSVLGDGNPRMNMRGNQGKFQVVVGVLDDIGTMSVMDSAQKASIIMEAREGGEVQVIGQKAKGGKGEARILMEDGTGNREITPRP